MLGGVVAAYGLEDRYAVGFVQLYGFGKHLRIGLLCLAAAAAMLVPSGAVYVGFGGTSLAGLSGESLQRAAGEAGLTARSPVRSLRDAQAVLNARTSRRRWSAACLFRQMM
ncbi:hypothetical protein OG729_01810 [Streptomyces sp. NBC_00210]|uniref:hypothetical protein n=1 Tax=unclassified Streptomyces TaxID=2593676 RepID=UPI00324AD5A5